jgi:peptidoglycan/LPS O-acetylase OafA/YrhL
MHKNNFDFLRFLFATLVVFTHSFDLLLQHGQEPLRVCGRGMSASFIGLNGFFIISGFLIFESYKRSSSVKSFLWKRFLRIIPGLFVAMILTVLFCGLVITNINTVDFFLSKESLTFIARNSTLLHQVQWSLPGVFGANPNQGTVNGSIWTIGYELFFYLCLALLFFVKRLENRNFFLLLLGISIVLRLVLSNVMWLHIPFSTLQVYATMNFGQYFLAGMILNTMVFLFQNKTYNTVILCCATVLFVGSIYFNVTEVVSVFTLPLIVISVAHIPGRLNNFGSFGDFSYGIYVYSFVIQQTIISFSPKISPMILFSYAFILSLFMGVMSWHLVEKRALKLKTIR